MSGINDTMKREEVVDIFKKGKFNLLISTEMKLKGEGKVSWVEVNGIISGVEEVERTREGEAILLSDVWYSAVEKHRCVSPRILWNKLKFSRVKVCMAPMKRVKKEIGFGATWTGIWVV